MSNPHTITSALVILFFTTTAHATILTVHNDPLYNAQYSTINAAITAASAGDTLLVHGSPVSYGNFTLTKSLAIIGPGHDPAKGPSASFTLVTLNAGSNGSQMEGLAINQLTVNAPDVIVRGIRNTVYFTTNSSADGLLVSGCLIVDSYIDIDPGAQNVEVRNCYFSNSSQNSSQFRSGSATTLVHSCVFERSSTSTSTSNRIFYASTSFPVFADNVFITATVAAFNPDVCPNYSFQNNLSYSTAGAVVSMGPNNLDNVAPTWNLASGLTAFNYGDDYNMLSGVPLTGASDGGQVGVMGGTTPLDKAGRPKNVPLVTSTTLLTPYVPVNGTIDVNFQAEQGQPQ